MGYIRYSDAQRYEFDDRTIAHLKVVIASKLRREESFPVSWVYPPDQGSGRTTIWVSPTLPIEFYVGSSDVGPMNRHWVQALADTSHGARGLFVMSEAEAEQAYESGEIIE
ncbi:hypothetical protein [Paramicrobacterium agarici]|uniref:DUF7882 domain-containing protein n=1 Tax=Paramicrobacterium agarici TaxID=630514 RepID=A0A2A9DYT9_9MICO|nr:hypothetical protein [Microbacterium agarici]PFG31481.1 hypothetical protein ATJ78_2450 [Microbacterium agarici]TQO21369.1 hypothetical protein FB385_0169 [Microbacterium agarici]